MEALSHVISAYLPHSASNNHLLTAFVERALSFSWTPLKRGKSRQWLPHTVAPLLSEPTTFLPSSHTTSLPLSSHYLFLLYVHSSYLFFHLFKGHSPSGFWFYLGRFCTKHYLLALTCYMQHKTNAQKLSSTPRQPIVCLVGLIAFQINSSIIPSISMSNSTKN